MTLRDASIFDGALGGEAGFMVEREGRSDNFLTALRKESRIEHEGVDQVFSRFNLQDPVDYGAFLSAHARVIPVLERGLKAQFEDANIGWREDALRQDMHALGQEMPPEMPWHSIQRDGHAMGVLYVLEGSKLGGRVLAKRVPEGMPSAYLSSVHEAGVWPLFLNTLRVALSEGDEAYRADVLEGARQAFALFAASGRSVV